MSWTADYGAMARRTGGLRAAHVRALREMDDGLLAALLVGIEKRNRNDLYAEARIAEAEAETLRTEAGIECLIADVETAAAEFEWRFREDVQAILDQAFPTGGKQ